MRVLSPLKEQHTREGSRHCIVGHRFGVQVDTDADRFKIMGRNLIEPTIPLEFPPDFEKMNEQDRAYYFTRLSSIYHHKFLNKNKENIPPKAAFTPAQILMLLGMVGTSAVYMVVNGYAGSYEEASSNGTALAAYEHDSNYPLSPLGESFSLNQVLGGLLGVWFSKSVSGFLQSLCKMQAAGSPVVFDPQRAAGMAQLRARSITREIRLLKNQTVEAICLSFGENCNQTLLLVGKQFSWEASASAHMPIVGKSYSVEKEISKKDYLRDAALPARGQGKIDDLNRETKIKVSEDEIRFLSAAEREKIAQMRKSIDSNRVWEKFQGFQVDYAQNLLDFLNFFRQSQVPAAAMLRSAVVTVLLPIMGDIPAYHRAKFFWKKVASTIPFLSGKKLYLYESSTYRGRDYIQILLHAQVGEEEYFLRCGVVGGYPSIEFINIQLHANRTLIFPGKGTQEGQQTEAFVRHLFPKNEPWKTVVSSQDVSAHKRAGAIADERAGWKIYFDPLKTFTAQESADLFQLIKTQLGFMSGTLLNTAYEGDTLHEKAVHDMYKTSSLLESAVEMTPIGDVEKYLEDLDHCMTRENYCSLLVVLEDNTALALDVFPLPGGGEGAKLGMHAGAKIVQVGTEHMTAEELSIFLKEAGGVAKQEAEGEMQRVQHIGPSFIAQHWKKIKANIARSQRLAQTIAHATSYAIEAAPKASYTLHLDLPHESFRLSLDFVKPVKGGVQLCFQPHGLSVVGAELTEESVRRLNTLPEELRLGMQREDVSMVVFPNGKTYFFQPQLDHRLSLGTMTKNEGDLWQFERLENQNFYSLDWERLFFTASPQWRYEQSMQERLHHDLILLFDEIKKEPLGSKISHAVTPDVHISAKIEGHYGKKVGTFMQEQWQEGRVQFVKSFFDPEAPAMGGLTFPGSSSAWMSRKELNTILFEEGDAGYVLRERFHQKAEEGLLEVEVNGQIVVEDELLAFCTGQRLAKRSLETCSFQRDIPVSEFLTRVEELPNIAEKSEQQASVKNIVDILNGYDLSLERVATLTQAFYNLSDDLLTQVLEEVYTHYDGSTVFYKSTTPSTSLMRVLLSPKHTGYKDRFWTLYTHLRDSASALERETARKMQTDALRLAQMASVHWQCLHPSMLFLAKSFGLSGAFYDDVFAESERFLDLKFRLKRLPESRLRKDVDISFKNIYAPLVGGGLQDGAQVMKPFAGSGFKEVKIQNLSVETVEKMQQALDKLHPNAKAMWKNLQVVYQHEKFEGSFMVGTQKHMNFLESGKNLPLAGEDLSFIPIDTNMASEFSVLPPWWCVSDSESLAFYFHDKELPEKFAHIDADFLSRATHFRDFHFHIPGAQPLTKEKVRDDLRFIQSKIDTIWHKVWIPGAQRPWEDMKFNFMNGLSPEDKERFDKALITMRSVLFTKKIEAYQDVKGLQKSKEFMNKSQTREALSDSSPESVA